jgi:putative FmdB family regulatory protein
MPTYDYECANCRRRFESLHGVYAPGPTACPLCGGGPVRKAISAPAVHFKGSGWAKKERHAAASSTTKGKGEGAGSDEAVPAAASTATATTDKSDKSDKSASSSDKPASSTDKATSDKGGD